MKITLGNATLCEGDARATDGTPVGPSDLRIKLAPGVAIREYVGADRVQPEHVRSDSGSLTFGVARTFATVADALAYLKGPFISEASEGLLKFDDAAVFGPKSVVTQRTAALDGCTVHVVYSITG